MEGFQIEENTRRMDGGTRNTEHGITEKQWMDYLDRTLPEAACARIRSHLPVCAECRGIYDQLLASESAVVQEISRAGEADVSVPNWNLFFRNLSKSVGCVYGSPARSLVERVGSLVGAEIHWCC